MGRLQSRAVDSIPPFLHQHTQPVYDRKISVCFWVKHLLFACVNFVSLFTFCTSPEDVFDIVHGNMRIFVPQHVYSFCASNHIFMNIVIFIASGAFTKVCRDIRGATDMRKMPVKSLPARSKGMLLYLVPGTIKYGSRRYKRTRTSNSV
jgi:hypothetical protein